MSIWLSKYEVITSEISNTINDLPLALVNIVNLIIDFYWKEVLVEAHWCWRLSWENKSIFNAWFHAWLLSQTTKLLQECKWFSKSYDIKILMLFCSLDSFMPYTSWKHFWFSDVFKGHRKRMKWVKKLAPNRRQITNKMVRVIKWIVLSSGIVVTPPPPCPYTKGGEHIEN